jgi:hypothetical protein
MKGTLLVRSGLQTLVNPIGSRVHFGRTSIKVLSHHSGGWFVPAPAAAATPGQAPLAFGAAWSSAPAPLSLWYLRR